VFGAPVGGCCPPAAVFRASDAARDIWSSWTARVPDYVRASGGMADAPALGAGAA
jgi:hypothetical protein